ncbi:hypothetical protein [Seonamhaeicola sp.]|uniref:hypothetical protein n=1 Tax=Seonamhaeicola sp. TaxID=1912245 RepID=UPI00260D2CBA|nr:hypothetical protein [Seonamhaeicola sp.]
MRTLIFTLAMVFIASGVFAQKRSDLKGPAYKNYKPWLNKDKSEPATVVYTTTKKEKLMGPAFKNNKPWQNNNNKEYNKVAFNSKRVELKGPAFKNYKPWKKDSDESKTKMVMTPNKADPDETAHNN